MNHFILGLKIMFRIWSDAAFAEKVEAVSDSKPVLPAVPEKPVRSEALTLLSVLQRETRLVDFIQESIQEYSDAQIGSAVRGIHDDCAKVFNRVFDLTPLSPEPDGATVDVPVGADSTRFRLVGNVVGEGPFRGKLAHPGWEATKCELPAWTGNEESNRVIAPCEVEIL